MASAAHPRRRRRSRGETGDSESGWHMTINPRRGRGLGDFGATMVEYALMLMLIALVVIAAVAVIGTNLSAFFDDTAIKI